MIACAGIAMLYSVAGGHFHPWALPQIVRFVAGLIMLVAAAVIDIRVWMSLAYPAYGVALLLLVAVDVAGHVGLGAQRWITLGPLELQPSELMKISLVLALCALPARQERGGGFQAARPLAIALAHDRHSRRVRGDGAQSGHHPDHRGWMAARCFSWRGFSWWWIAPALAAVAAAVPLAWRFVLHDYQKARVMTFLNPEADALGTGWNITQAKIAIGSGGVSGKGFLQGTQSRLNFLPEKQTDFIFTSFGEEFGFVGAMALLVLFAVVIFYGMQIAMSARSQFGRLLAMGITLNFFFYIMINGLMVMGLIPVVGIPMPLLSYGGTAMLTVMFGFGLLMSVHVHRQVEIPRHSGGII